jgi:hypothetical protein
MYIRTTLQKYNTVSYASDCRIQIHMHPFLLIAYICGFRKDRLLTEYIKNEWINKCNNGVLQWAKNACNIICNGNDLKLINLLRE